jgi:superfamily II DNA or RNA helicase
VDSAESVEPAGAGGTVVYNLEVEGSHTYFANGTLVHNCHHGPSPSYKRVFEHFGSAKLLGVTATPDRADEKAMGQVFESVAFVYEIEDAINDAWLVPIRVRQVFIDAIKLASCRTTAGDLNQGDLDAAMAVEEALHGVVNATIEQAGDRKTIVYTTSVDNATRLAEIFNRYQPNTARDVNGKTPIDTRRQILAGFERGDFQRLVNCGIATEGFDCPPVSCIAQARPTKSRSLHAQIVGRGLRPVYASGFDLETVEGRRQAIAAGKSDCLVLEFTGNSGKHRLSSAVDILGGRYDEDEVEAAKKLVQAKPGMRADEALAVAHAEAEKRRADESAKRARLKATTKYSTRDFSPFDVLGIKRTKSDDWGDRFGGAIATDKQVGYMRSMGIDVPKDCTKTQAMRLIGACQNRKAEGLANYSQVVKLGRAGIDGSKLRWQQAADLCWEVQQAGGRPSAEVVDRILNRERSAGEDG